MPLLRATLQDPEYKAFVVHVIGLRKKMGVTQAQLAARLDKPQSYISKTERFQRRLDPAEFRAFVLAIGGDPAAEFATVSMSLSTQAPV